MKKRAGNMNKIIATLLVLTAIVLVAGIAFNLATMTMPIDEDSGTSGKVNVYVTADVPASPATGEVSLVVTGNP